MGSLISEKQDQLSVSLQSRHVREDWLRLVSAHMLRNMYISVEGAWHTVISRSNS